MLMQGKIVCISVWVLCLLVQLCRACKSLGSWDEQEYSSHIFFYAVTKTIKIILKAESGSKEADDNMYEKIYIRNCRIAFFSNR